MLTLLEMLTKASGYLQEKGADSPRLDAEVLLAHQLRLQRIDLYLQFERPVREPEQNEYRERIRRRAAGEPVAYITGTKEFWSLSFGVSPAVLIPRPETELLVEEALKCLNGEAKPRIVDVGTGSGAIAVAIAKELPHARVFATDTSSDALACAGANAEANEVRVELREGTCLEPVAADGPFDLVVSNPPYIPSADVAGLPIDVRDYEPHMALDGGTDGLDVYRVLVPAAAALLRPGGWLVLESALGGADDVADLLTGFEKPRIATDLAGVKRVVIAQTEQ